MNKIKLSDIKVGSVVVVRAWGGGEHTVTVTNVEADIKNGEPGIDHSNGGWCYLRQIVRIITK